MRVVYFANHGNKWSDTTEKHIQKAFEDLGHKVIPLEEKNYSREEILKQKGDVFLFHKGGEKFNVSVEELIEILSHIPYKKVCWYFDKIWQGREEWMDKIIPYTDFVFLTDATWARRHTYKNVYVLRQGIGSYYFEGKIEPKKEYECDIAFTGSVYGDREKFVNALKEVYGDKFKLFNSCFGRNLFELCATAKIIVSPMYPQDDFYWSSRIYQILGSNGFLIHPRLEGLKEEYEEGGHYVGFSNGAELRSAIDFFLDEKNKDMKETIRRQGYRHTINNYTYRQRIEKMLEIIK